MGIPGLTRALKPFGSQKDLSGEGVVIDGPALIYHVWGRVMNSQTLESVILGQVPYTLICQSTIQWLDGLRAKNIDVRKIYFDGFLPPRKWETRRQRLIAQTKTMASTAHQRIWVAPQPNEALVGEIKPGGFHGPSAGVQELPKHPFLVPAMIDFLRTSDDWKSVIQVVPGEADAFCAQDIKQNGGVVLTADSDLLIEDLGPRGSVAFFWDIRDGPGEGILSARNFDPRALEEQFKLQETGGMPRLAFAMSKKRISIEEAIRRAQEVLDPDSIVNEHYQKFVSEHLKEEYIADDHPVLSQLSTLDPRISELVIQSLNIEVMTKEAQKPRYMKAPRGPEELSMFLPVMIEDPSKKSSWSMSEAVRQLAYGIAQPAGTEHRLHRMIEYRTLETVTGGRRLSIPSAADVDSWCEQLLKMLKELDRGIGEKNPAVRWITLAICQDIQWSNSEHRTPISTQLLSEALRFDNDSRPEEYSWNTIHFTTQTQASLYSLRMLKQILDVTASLSPDSRPASKPQEELRRHLGALPEISEYPVVETTFDLLRQFGQADGLAVVAKVLGVETEDLLGVSKPQAWADAFGFRRKKQKKRRGGNDQPQRPGSQKKIRSPSVNPFALLSSEALEEDDD